MWQTHRVWEISFILYNMNMYVCLYYILYTLNDVYAEMLVHEVIIRRSATTHIAWIWKSKTVLRFEFVQILMVGSHYMHSYWHLQAHHTQAYHFNHIRCAAKVCVIVWLQAWRFEAHHRSSAKLCIQTNEILPPLKRVESRIRQTYTNPTERRGEVSPLAYDIVTPFSSILCAVCMHFFVC